MENCIYYFRGEKVLLDSDLANILNVKTKRINEIVSRNKELFLEDYTWVLNDEEMISLWSQNATANVSKKSRVNSRVFTKEGVLLLLSKMRNKNVKEINEDIINLFEENERISRMPGNIRDLIYEIDGKQVMLDVDLANLYQCKNGTKEINQAVKNNIEKFPNRLSWMLSEEESYNLRSKILTSSLRNNTYGGRRYNIRVFTEQGVYMLATVLKSRVATEVTLNIMDTFVLMRKYINSSEYRLTNIETKLIEHDDKINMLTKSFNEIEGMESSNTYISGEVFDSYSRVNKIFKEAKKELIIIDSYADVTTLEIIKKLEIEVTIVTKKDNLLTLQDIDKYNTQYSNLKVIYDNTYHDRYFILDRSIVYHCGASINRIGYKTFSITKLSDEIVIKNLLNNYGGKNE